MGDRIRINCKKVYDNGVDYIENSEEILEIQKDLKQISEDIKNAWKGADDHNFGVSFNKHIADLDLIIGFLSENGDLLKQNASGHEGIDNNFATQMERSEIHEYE